MKRIDQFPACPPQAEGDALIRLRRRKAGVVLSKIQTFSQNPICKSTRSRTEPARQLPLKQGGELIKRFQMKRID